MPDASAYPARYPYFHPNYRRARAAAAARSPDHCQSCGGLTETEAHHWSRKYPRADEVTADDLSMFCWCCHDTTHDFILFTMAGGSPAEFRTIVSDAVARALLRRAGIWRDLRVGRPRRFDKKDEWGALVGGGSRPRPGEVVWLVLHSKNKLAPAVVTAVVSGRPGCWLIRKRWHAASPVSTVGNAVAA